jgi:hypothetical protein
MNKFAVTVRDDQPNELLCQFDYLDPGDGATIDLLHTAERGRPASLGTIRAVPAGVQDWGRPSALDLSIRKATYARFMRFTTAFIPIFGASLIGFAIYVNSWYAHAPLLLFGLVYLFCGIDVLRSRRRAPKQLRIEDS